MTEDLMNEWLLYANGEKLRACTAHHICDCLEERLRRLTLKLVQLQQAVRDYKTAWQDHLYCSDQYRQNLFDLIEKQDKVQK